jgi:hypothetical protein
MPMRASGATVGWSIGRLVSIGLSIAPLEARGARTLRAPSSSYQAAGKQVTKQDRRRRVDCSQRTLPTHANHVGGMLARDLGGLSCRDPLDDARHKERLDAQCRSCSATLSS